MTEEKKFTKPFEGCIQQANGTFSDKDFHDLSDDAEQKPKLKLVGQDGNAFMVMGLAQRAAKKAGWTKEEFDKFLEECQSGDYNHLLATVQEHFEVY